MSIIQEKDKRFLLFVERLVKKGLMGVVLFLLDEIQKLEDRISGTLKGEDGHTPTEKELVALIEPLIPEPIKGKDGRDGVNGKDGINGIDGENGKNGERGMDGKDGVDGSPDSPQQIREKLESLKGDDRLDKSAIKGLEEEIEKLRQIRTSRTGALGGVLSVGVRVETPEGTIDGVNTIFTAYKFPKYVVGDGITYFENQGYTYSAKTLTMTIPPSNYLRSFY